MPDSFEFFRLFIHPCDRVDGKDNHEDETMEFHDDIMITSVRIIGLLLLLAGALLLPLHIDDVMNLDNCHQGGIKWGIRGSGILDSEGSHR